MTITLSPGGTLAVLVTGPGGPVDGARVRVFGPDGREIARYLSEETMMTGPPSRVTEASGRLQIDNLPSGSLRVVASTPDGRSGETEATVGEGETTDAVVEVK